MDRRVRWIEHKGKKIIYLDLQKLADKHYIETLVEFEKFVLENKKNRNLCSLTNVTGARVFGQALLATKRIAKTTRPFLKKQAVVGLSEAKKILAQAVNMFAGSSPTLPFKTEEEALKLDFLKNEIRPKCKST